MKCPAHALRPRLHVLDGGPFANPVEAVAIMAKYQKELSPAVIEGETRLVGELAEVKGKPLGSIDPKSIGSSLVASCPWLAPPAAENRRCCVWSPDWKCRTKAPCGV